MSTAATPTALNGQGLHRMPQAVENKKLGVARRSTPDSEALLSSDDDHEPSSTMSMSLHSAQSMPAQRPIRRASWLSEVRTSQRKYSLGGLSLASAGGSSQPPTPSAENGHTLERLGSQGQLGSSLSLWETAPARPVASQNSASPANPWGSHSTAHIWSKKDAPRWNDFSSSPSLSHSAVDDLRSPTAQSAVEAANPTSVSSIPFDIPLEPNRKTVRSQSYSAGQLDLPLGTDPYPRFKTKRILPPSLSRRKSRTVVVDSNSEFDLASVQEDTSDSMELPHPDALPGGGVRLFPSPRSERVNIASPSSYTTAQDIVQQSPGSMPHIEDEQPQTPHSRLSRPSQEFQTPMQSTQATGGPSLQQRHVTDNTTDNNDPFSDNMVTLNIQRAAREAQETLAIAEGSNRPYFGAEGAPQPSQATQQAYANASRLHSLGRLPAPEYHNLSVDPNLSFSTPWPNTTNTSRGAEQQPPTPTAGKTDAIYMGGNPNSYDFDADFRATPYHNQADPEHFLYIVTFKSSRADVYWIPENFGTSPKVGDMVIVEGDRGDDLGMVAHVNLTFAQAKLLKKEYNRKHYKVLVQFARIFRNLQDTLPHHDEYDNVSGYNLGDQNHATRKNPNPQPKLIKRIATDREIMLLREKEGNEARAKRICQGKINQHRLNMEILDAEFQLDYRKLTFYFYAENYINFNNIVVDLFKVWKTRIWLSAVNPETYPAPPSRPGDRPRRNPSGGGANRGGNALSNGNNASAPGNEDREHDVRNSTAYMMGIRDMVTGQFPAALAASFMNPNMHNMTNMNQPNQGFNSFQSYNYPNQSFGGNSQFAGGMPMQNQPGHFPNPQMANLPGLGAGNGPQSPFNAGAAPSQGGNMNNNGNAYNSTPFNMNNSFGSPGPNQGNFGMNNSFSPPTSVATQAQFAIPNAFGNFPMGYGNTNSNNAYGGFPYANTMASTAGTTSAASPPGLQAFGNRRELPPAFIPRSQQPVSPVTIRSEGQFSMGHRESPIPGAFGDDLVDDLNSLHLDKGKQRKA